MLGEGGVCSLRQCHVGHAVDAVQHQGSCALKVPAILLRGREVDHPGVPLGPQHAQLVQPPLHGPAARRRVRRDLRACSCLTISQVQAQRTRSRERAPSLSGAHRVKQCIQEFVSPVWALHGVDHQGAVCSTSRRLASRVRAEPVVGEDCVRRAMLQAVLEEVDPHARDLSKEHLIQSGGGAAPQICGLLSVLSCIALRGEATAGCKPSSCWKHGGVSLHEPCRTEVAAWQAAGDGPRRVPCRAPQILAAPHL